VVGLQGKAQLETIYGHLAETLLAMPWTALFFKTTEPDAAEWISRFLAVQEVERWRHSQTSGESGFSPRREPKTDTDERFNRQAVSASEISGLPERKGYLKSGNFIVPLTIARHDVPIDAKGFIPRELPPMFPVRMEAKKREATALVGGDKRVRDAHRENAGVALDDLERFAQVRMGGNNPTETTGRWFAAKSEHDSARPVDGYAAPQLQTHVVFFNIIETENGNTHAIQPQELYMSQKFATAIYQSELGYRLKELGYEIDPGKNGAPETKGYTREYLEESGPRSQQIRAHLEEYGLEGAGPTQIAAHRTREGKSPLTAEEILERHREVAKAFGNRAQRIVEQAQTRRAQEHRSIQERATRAREAVTYARERNIEREAGWMNGN
jgi:hypothetical protein